MLIAQNNLQFILKVAVIIHVGVLLLFNVVAVPLSLVMFLGTLITIIIALVFALDAAFLLLPLLSHHEFTHPFGPFAVLFWVTMVASLNLLTEAGIRSTSIKKLSLLLFFIIAIAGESCTDHSLYSGFPDGPSDTYSCPGVSGEAQR